MLRLDRSMLMCPDAVLVFCLAVCRSFVKPSHLSKYDAGLMLQFWCIAGVLYYADHAAHGVRASDFVTELNSKADLQKFINGQADNVLTVIDVSLKNAAPCIHIFPAVLALAKNFEGYAHFARLIGDENEETQALIKELDVNEVCSLSL